MDYSITAKRLKELRQSKKLSHEQLSEKLKLNFDIDINSRTLMNYESAAKDILHSKASSVSGMSIEKLDAIARFYNVSTDYLLGFTTIDTANNETRFVCEYTGLNVEAVEALHNWAVESKAEWFPTSNEFLNILIQHFAIELCGFSQQYKSKLQKTIKIKKSISSKADTLKGTDKLVQQMFKAEDESKLAHFELKETFDRLVDLFAKAEKIENQDLDKNMHGKFYFYRDFSS